MGGLVVVALFFIVFFIFIPIGTNQQRYKDFVKDSYYYITEYNTGKIQNIERECEKLNSTVIKCRLLKDEGKPYSTYDSIYDINMTFPVIFDFSKKEVYLQLKDVDNTELKVDIQKVVKDLKDILKDKTLRTIDIYLPYGKYSYSDNKLNHILLKKLDKEGEISGYFSGYIDTKKLVYSNSLTFSFNEVSPKLIEDVEKETNFTFIPEDKLKDKYKTTYSCKKKVDNNVDIINKDIVYHNGKIITFDCKIKKNGEKKSFNREFKYYLSKQGNIVKTEVIK